MTLNKLTFALAFALPIFSLNQSASAYLHPTHGRFIQRDPASYEDGLLMYQVSQNNPSGWRDPTGLESCCDIVGRDPNTPPGALGGVGCCNGVKTACTWPDHAPPGYWTDDASKNLILECAKVHETQHFPDVYCAMCGSASRAIPNPGSDFPSLECGAKRVEVQCLIGKKATCPTQACRYRIQQEIDLINQEISDLINDGADCALPHPGV